MEAPNDMQTGDYPSTDVARCQESRRNLFFWELAMDLKVKSLRSPDGKNHLIIITGGLIDTEGLQQIFRQVAETIRRQFNCRILIDFEKANLRLEPAVIDEVVNELGPELRLGNIKIALVSPAKREGYERLRALSDALTSQDLKATVFDTTKEAVTWLVDTA
jgi:hypothetical protein